MQQDEPGNQKSSHRFGVVILVCVVITALLIARIGPFGGRGGGGGASDTPPMFTQGVSLQQALDDTRDDGRFVVVVASAVWCGPCQTYKRTALRDPGVEAWVRENGIALYIDVDQDKDDAAMLGVRAMPTTFVYHRGRVVASTVGAMNADRLRGWLDQQRTVAMSN